MFGRHHVDWCTVVPPSLVAIGDTCFETLSRGPARRLEILNMPVEVCGQRVCQCAAYSVSWGAVPIFQAFRCPAPNVREPSLYSSVFSHGRLVEIQCDDHPERKNFEWRWQLR